MDRAQLNFSSADEREDIKERVDAIAAEQVCDYLNAGARAPTLTMDGAFSRNCAIKSWLQLGRETHR
jgi:hypothetical protein